MRVLPELEYAAIQRQTSYLTRARDTMAGAVRYISARLTRKSLAVVVDNILTESPTATNLQISRGQVANATVSYDNVDADRPTNALFELPKVVLNGIKLKGYTINDTPSLELKSEEISHDDMDKLCKFLERHPSLTFLKLTRSWINVESLALLAGNTTLKKLDLSSARISARFYNRLIMPIFTSNTTLTTLNLSGIRLFNKNISLERNATIESILWGEYRISNEDIQTLVNMKTLRFINLSGTHISDTGAQILANSSSIIDLDLSANDIGYRGSVALSANTTLRSINLSDNNIGDVEIRFFAERSTLRSFGISDHYAVSDHYASRLKRITDASARALDLNTTLMAVNLGHLKYMSPQGLDKIECAVKRNQQSLHSQIRFLVFSAIVNNKNVHLPEHILWIIGSFLMDTQRAQAIARSAVNRSSGNPLLVHSMFTPLRGEARNGVNSKMDDDTLPFWVNEDRPM